MPLHNNYANTFIEVDGGGSWGRLKAGTFVTHTFHEEFVGSPETALQVGETDFKGFAGLTTGDWLWAVTGAKSLYSDQIGQALVVSPQVATIPGLDAVIQAFPNVLAHARVERTGNGIFKPYLSYTYATFKLALPSARVYGAGFYLDLSKVELDLAYQLFDRAEIPKRNFLTLGLSWQF